MKQTTAPADHSALGHTLTSFEHTLYANFHHIWYLPILLFVAACVLILMALITKQNTAPTRVTFYLVAVLLVVVGVFIL